MAGAAATIMVACALGAGAEKSDRETFKDCLEGFGDTVCKPMRDDGNMNNACAQAVVHCAEQAENGEGSRHETQRSPGPKAKPPLKTERDPRCSD